MEVGERQGRQTKDGVKAPHFSMRLPGEVVEYSACGQLPLSLFGPPSEKLWRVISVT